MGLPHLSHVAPSQSISRRDLGFRQLLKRARNLISVPRRASSCLCLVGNALAVFSIEDKVSSSRGRYRRRCIKLRLLTGMKAGRYCPAIQRLAATHFGGSPYATTPERRPKPKTGFCHSGGLDTPSGRPPLANDRHRRSYDGF